MWSHSHSNLEFFCKRTIFFFPTFFAAGFSLFNHPTSLKKWLNLDFCVISSKQAKIYQKMIIKNSFLFLQKLLVFPIQIHPSNECNNSCNIKSGSYYDVYKREEEREKIRSVTREIRHLRTL